MGGLVADQVGPADLVVPGVDLGDGVGAEVGDEDLASIGFHGEMDRGMAYVEHGEEMVGGGGGVLTGWPGAGRGGEADDHDLMASGAGDEGFGGVGKDGDVSGSGAAGEGGAEPERGAGVAWGGERSGGLLRIELVYGRDAVDGDAAAAAVGDDEGAHVGRDSGRVPGCSPVPTTAISRR